MPSPIVRGLLSLAGIHRIELDSPFLLPECLDRLSQQIGRRVDDPGKWKPLLPIIGRRKGSVFTARRNLTMPALGSAVRRRNSFQTFMRARLSEGLGGTRIRCTFSAHPAVLAFSLFWVCAVSAGFFIEPGAWHVCLAMLCFFAVLMVVGRLGASDDRQLLTDFLLSTLKARVISEP